MPLTLSSLTHQKKKTSRFNTEEESVPRPNLSYPFKATIPRLGLSSSMFQRALCCFPGFSNPGAMSRKGKIPKPLLAGVESAGGSSTASSKSRLLGDDTSPSNSEAASGILDFAAARFKSRLSDGKPEDMMLLEKQGRSSQRQRMQEQHHLHGSEPRRAGSLPPSSLPRPPRSLKSQNSRYCRLSDSETRKKSDPGLEAQLKARDSGNCTLEYGRFDGVKVLRRKKSSESILSKKVHEYERLAEKSNSLEIKRSLIPPPPRHGRIEYGRLSDGDAPKQSTRKSHESSSSSRGQSTGSIMSTKSETSTASLQPPMLKPNNRSIPRPSNYRIQF